MVPAINRQALRKAGAVNAAAKGAKRGIIAHAGVSITTSGLRSVCQAPSTPKGWLTPPHPQTAKVQEVDALPGKRQAIPSRYLGFRRNQILVLNLSSVSTL